MAIWLVNPKFIVEQQLGELFPMYEKRSFEEEVAALKESMNRANWQAMTTLGFDNSRGTRLYEYQVEYCYMIDSIERDSRFVAGKLIPKVRELISNLRKECNEAKDSKDS